MSHLHTRQRGMRQLRKAAMQRGVVAVVDIGTHKIAVLVLKFDTASPFEGDEAVGSLAGQADFRVIGAATTRSRGVRFGEIETMAETERAIRTALQTSQKMANQRVDHVMVSFAGGRPRSYGLDGQIELNNAIVEDGDVARVLVACDVPDYGAHREVLHAQPVNFAIDHRTGLNDPRGQMGNKLNVDMHMVSVDEATVHDVLYCTKRCDLELAGMDGAAYASGLSALVEDEQELGAACIDFGAGVTSLSIFIKKHMIYTDAVRIGGNHITNDLSLGLKVSSTQAERIKTLYGGVMATGMDDREMIEVGGETGDWEHDRRAVSRAEVIGVMRPRVEEILEELRARLDAAGFDHLPSRQIVLTGGGSQIPGLDGLASRILGQQVRLGRPLRVQGLPQAMTGPAFASVVGTALSAAHPQDEWWDFEIPLEAYPSRSLKRAVRWFKDNW
ncbi:MAG: cell division protein FtsA [Pseudomonadota bacterium]